MEDDTRGDPGVHPLARLVLLPVLAEAPAEDSPCEAVVRCRQWTVHLRNFADREEVPLLVEIFASQSVRLSIRCTWTRCAPPNTVLLYKHNTASQHEGLQFDTDPHKDCCDLLIHHCPLLSKNMDEFPPGERVTCCAGMSDRELLSGVRERLLMSTW